MADNIAVTPGSGATLATDQMTGDGSHVQIVKLADGTANGTDRVAATATYGLEVDPTRLPDLVPARDRIQVAGSALNVLTAQVLVDSSGGAGTVELVAATAGYSIRVHSIFMVSTAVLGIKFVSGAAGDILPVLPLAANTPYNLAPPVGHVMECDGDEALNATTDATGIVTGYVVYSLIPS